MTIGNRITFYIPYVIKDHDRYSITNEFNDAGIGQVDRIDFVKNQHCAEAFSVHVHVYPYDSPIMHDIIDAHSKKLAYYHKVSSTNSVSTRSIHTEFWWVCKTTNPIPDSYMNNHQAAFYIQTLEAKVEELTKKINDLEDKVNTIEKIPEWLHDNYDQEPLTYEDLCTSTHNFDSIADDVCIPCVTPSTNEIDTPLTMDDLRTELDNLSQTDEDSVFEELEETTKRTLIPITNTDSDDYYGEVDSFTIRMMNPIMRDYYDDEFEAEF